MDLGIKGKRAIVCSLTIQWPDGKKISEVGIIKGNISSKKGDNGFGYDPIFKPKNFTKSFGELSIEIKNKISHRGIAIRKLINFLNEIKN